MRGAELGLLLLLLALALPLQAAPAPTPEQLYLSFWLGSDSCSTPEATSLLTLQLTEGVCTSVGHTTLFGQSWFMLRANTSAPGEGPAGVSGELLMFPAQAGRQCRERPASRRLHVDFRGCVDGGSLLLEPQRLGLSVDWMPAPRDAPGPDQLELVHHPLSPNCQPTPAPTQAPSPAPTPELPPPTPAPSPAPTPLPSPAPTRTLDPAARDLTDDPKEVDEEPQSELRIPMRANQCARASDSLQFMLTVDRLAPSRFSLWAFGSNQGCTGVPIARAHSILIRDCVSSSSAGVGGGGGFTGLDVGSARLLLIAGPAPTPGPDQSSGSSGWTAVRLGLMAGGLVLALLILGCCIRKRRDIYTQVGYCCGNKTYYNVEAMHHRRRDQGLGLELDRDPFTGSYRALE